MLDFCLILHATLGLDSYRPITGSVIGVPCPDILSLLWTRMIMHYDFNSLTRDSGICKSEHVVV